MPVTSIDKIEERLRINFPEEIKASEELVNSISADEVYEAFNEII